MHTPPSQYYIHKVDMDGSLIPMFDVMIDSTNTYRRSQMLISVRVVLLLWVTVCVGVCNCAHMDVIIVRPALMGDTDTF